MTDAVERIVNLALFLAAAQEPVNAERIRTEVCGYPDGQEEPAFKRMFERDKDDLKKMGFVIEGDPEGNYRLDSSATYASAIELTPTEISTVRIAGMALVDDPSFPFSEDLRLALAKISAEVDGGDIPSAARLADEDPERQGEAVAVLSSAATRSKCVTFGYTNSFDVSAPHEVEPYGLFLHDGRWYLVGRDTALDEIRTYAVARMTSVEANPAAPKTPDFERPADFEVSAFVRLPFQYGAEEEFVAELVFAPGSAWRARMVAAGQGELATGDDGSVRWRVPARSGRRLLRFAIENGPGIGVAGPAEVLGGLEQGLTKVVAIHE